MGQFFGAWKAQNFRAMYWATNYSWRRFGSVSELRAQYDFKHVRSWKILHVKRNSALASDVKVRVTYKVFGKRKTVRITARVLKETRSGDLSPSGKFGVNPVSTLREN